MSRSKDRKESRRKLPGAAEMCAKEVWGDRGHSPITKAELDKLIAELEPTRPGRTITEGTNKAGVEAAKAALASEEKR